MLLHSPFCLVEAIFHGVADTRESFQVRRIEAEIVRLGGRLDNKRIGQLDHFIHLWVLDAGGFQYGLPCADGHFLRSMIIDPHQPLPALLAVCPALTGALAFDTNPRPFRDFLPARLHRHVWRRLRSASFLPSKLTSPLDSWSSTRFAWRSQNRTIRPTQTRPRRPILCAPRA